MKSLLIGLFGCGIAAASGGCGYDHSVRKGPGPDFARHVYSLYDEPAAGRPPAPAASPRTPADVAVAELGQLAPPPALLERLEKEPALFRRVEGIPGIANGDYESDPYADLYRSHGVGREADGQSPQDAARAAMRRLMRLARDAGMDYLVLLGATVDSDAHPTGLAVADVTIVGSYLVPSRHVTGRARAAAVMVDVRTERVVLSTGTEANDARLASAVDQSGSQVRQIQKLRDQSFAALGERVVAELTRRAGRAPAAAELPAAAVAADPFAGPVASPRSIEPGRQLTGPGAAAAGPLPPDPVPARR